MKYVLFILLLSAVVYYQILPYQRSIEITSWHQLVNKTEQQGATLNEVKQGVHHFAQGLCNDRDFQLAEGSSIERCQQEYQTRHVQCEKSVFAQTPKRFHDKNNIGVLAKRFYSCVTQS